MNQLIPDSDTSTQLAPGVSGRKLTVAMLVLLAVLGSAITFLLAVYDKINVQRSRSQEVWRTVADGLDRQYKQIESLKATESAIDAAWLTEFKVQAEQFRTATSIEVQTVIANRLESQLNDLSGKGLAAELAIGDGLKDQVAQYNQSVQAENALFQTWSGRFVHAILPAPELPLLELHR